MCDSILLLTSQFKNVLIDVRRNSKVRFRTQVIHDWLHHIYEAFMLRSQQDAEEPDDR